MPWLKTPLKHILGHPPLDDGTDNPPDRANFKKVGVPDFRADGCTVHFPHENMETRPPHWPSIRIFFATKIQKFWDKLAFKLCIKNKTRRHWGRSNGY